MLPLKDRSVPVRCDGCNDKGGAVPAKRGQSRRAGERQLLGDQGLTADIVKLVKVRSAGRRIDRRQDVPLAESYPEKPRVPADA